MGTIVGARTVGEPLDWRPVKRPQRVGLRGSHVLVRPVEPDDDAEPLFGASHPPGGDLSIWTYLPDGPYESPRHLRGMLRWTASSEQDSLYFTLAALPGEHPVGIAAYLNITPACGVIEIGEVLFGVPLQGTTAATEAIYLLLRYAFDDLSYRRVEWKCDSLNAPSRRSAERFGFTFEGVCRKHRVIKRRNQDTARYAITDEEWPLVRHGYDAWLATDNFDDAGRQRQTLGELIYRSRHSLALSLLDV